MIETTQRTYLLSQRYLLHSGMVLIGIWLALPVLSCLSWLTGLVAFVAALVLSILLWLITYTGVVVGILVAVAGATVAIREKEFNELRVTVAGLSLSITCYLLSTILGTADDLLWALGDRAYSSCTFASKYLVAFWWKPAVCSTLLLVPMLGSALGALSCVLLIVLYPMFETTRNWISGVRWTCPECAARAPIVRCRCGEELGKLLPGPYGVLSVTCRQCNARVPTQIVPNVTHERFCSVCRAQYRHPDQGVMREFHIHVWGASEIERQLWFEQSVARLNCEHVERAGLSVCIGTCSTHDTRSRAKQLSFRISSGSCGLVNWHVSRADSIASEGIDSRFPVDGIVILASRDGPDWQAQAIAALLKSADRSADRLREMPVALLVNVAATQVRSDSSLNDLMIRSLSDSLRIRKLALGEGHLGDLQLVEATFRNHRFFSLDFGRGDHHAMAWIIGKFGRYRMTQGIQLSESS